nr:integrase core domain-containing protein [Corynebacterium sp. MSK072]MDK8831522.1 integrase core domain-containing protein [Corynebacterium sp. MSK072]
MPINLAPHTNNLTRSRNEARKAVARWIEIVYNRRRRHSSIGMVSPVDFEAQLADQNGNKKAAA